MWVVIPSCLRLGATEECDGVKLPTHPGPRIVVCVRVVGTVVFKSMWGTSETVCHQYLLKLLMPSFRTTSLLERRKTVESGRPLFDLGTVIH